jgi:hypothetical protein
MTPYAFPPHTPDGAFDAKNNERTHRAISSRPRSALFEIGKPEVTARLQHLATAISGRANGWCTVGRIRGEGIGSYTAPTLELGTQLWRF